MLDALTDGQPKLRSWAHCGRGADAHLGGGEEGGGDVAVLLINLDTERARSASLAGLGARHDVYLLQSDGLLSNTLRLNGALLEADEAGGLPSLAPEQRTAVDEAVVVELPPGSMAFVHFPLAAAPACIF